MRQFRQPSTRSGVVARCSARRVGFTLLELVVVSGVIGILALMLIPSLKRSVRLAASTVCMHNLREIGYSLHMYRMENDGWLPQATVEDSTSMDFTDARDTPSPEPWFVQLWPSPMSNLQLMTCPEDPFKFRMPTSPTETDVPVAEIGNLSSYGISSFIMTSGNGFLANLDRHRPRRPLDTILVADMGPDTVTANDGGGLPVGPARNGSFLMWDDSFDPFSPGSQTTWLTIRHGEGINVLTIDGAVRETQTVTRLSDPILPHYADCASGGCTLCNYLYLPHYSFASDRLYWWTGPPPTE